MPEADNEVYSEKHYPVSHFAKLWGVSPDTVRRLCVGVAGVIRLQKQVQAGRRRYVTLRISESAARLIYLKLSTPSEPPATRPTLLQAVPRPLSPKSSKGAR
jgi:hypothetical protein